MGRKMNRAPETSGVGSPGQTSGWGSGSFKTRWDGSRREVLWGQRLGVTLPSQCLGPLQSFCFFLCGILLVCLYLSSISLFLRIPFSFAFSAVFSIVRLAFVIKDDSSGFLVTGLCFWGGNRTLSLYNRPTFYRNLSTWHFVCCACSVVSNSMWSHGL